MGTGSDVSAHPRPWSAERPLRLAIVDDSAIWVLGLRAALEGEAVTVLFTEATGAALLGRLAAGEIPDVVVMGIEMPPDGRESGVCAVRAIRERGHNVPVLLFSAFIEAALPLLREGVEGVGYLSKGGGTTHPRLLDALARMVRGELVVDEALVAKVMARPRAVRRMAELTEQQRTMLDREQGRGREG